MKKTIVTSVVVIVSGLVYMNSSREGKTSLRGVAGQKETAKAQVSSVKKEITPSSPASASMTATQEGVSPSAAPPAISTTPVWESKITEFQGLQRKAILSDVERLRKLELMQDPQFLQDVGAMLRSPEATRDLKNVDAGLDLLLEARRYSENEIVAQVLGEIVSDRSIEDGSVTMEERERLAQVKAEVMYRWSSADTMAAGQIPRLLPGSVSEKIWSNVLELQSQNAADSVKLADRYAQSGHQAPE